MAKKKICQTEGCANKVKPRGLYCDTCYNRKARLKNPMKFAYFDLRGNAKRRGVPFQLTFEEFKKLCRRYSYMTKKGRTATCYSLDRKVLEIGYVYSNMRVITVSANSRKRWLEYVQYPGGKGSIKWLTTEMSDNSDVPF